MQADCRELEEALWAIMYAEDALAARKRDLAKLSKDFAQKYSNKPGAPVHKSCRDGPAATHAPKTRTCTITANNAQSDRDRARAERAIKEQRTHEEQERFTRKKQSSSASSSGKRISGVLMRPELAQLTYRPRQKRRPEKHSSKTGIQGSSRKRQETELYKPASTWSSWKGREMRTREGEMIRASLQWEYAERCQ